MAKKLTFLMLVFLVVSAGLGYSAYAISQQISSLDRRMASFQSEQTAQTGALSDEVAAIRDEALASTDSLKARIDESLTEIDTLKNGLDGAAAKIDTLKEGLDGAAARIDTMEGSLKSAASLSKSVLDASKVYQTASQATVRISNGNSTIGSGFILDAESHIITAYHVVNDLTDIYAIMPDGRVFRARNIGDSIQSDIAVLKLDGELAIEAPVMADSDKIKIGEPVALIGNPFNLTETLTAGIISQTERYIDIKYKSQTSPVANLIQVDAAANSGNSGCPMLNSSGEVIGMIIARVDPDLGDGIYYGVSSNKLKRVAASLIENGFYDYPWIGIDLTDLTPDEAHIRRLDTVNGAMVTEVPAGNSPALAAGIRAGDVIVAVDDMAIRNRAEFNSYLGEHKSPGDPATIELIRGNDRLTLHLNIGKDLS